VNIKKGQFLAPGDMKNVVDKAKAANGGADTIMVCERGVSFGYNTLISDMRGLATMRETGCPVVFDATHSVQQPGGQGDRSGGQREFVPVLARAAVAVGIAGLFAETHPDPAKAMSDGPNAWPLHLMQELLETLRDIDALVKQKGFIEARLSRTLKRVRRLPPVTDLRVLIKRKKMSAIVDVIAREILDSRGNPTIEADVLAGIRRAGPRCRPFRCLDRQP
jgi:hypothetical protein